jgi:sugar lactone lactonase YvrE
MQRIQMMSRGQRVVVFVLIFGGGLMLIVAILVFVLLQIVNNAPRETSVTRFEEPVELPTLGLTAVEAAEFAYLPGDNAYPAAVAVAPDGTIYTASRINGTVWSIPTGGNIDPEGQAVLDVILPIPDTEASIGAVSGLDVAPDGTVYVVDRIDSNPRAAGGTVWAITPAGQLTDLGEIDTIDGFISPGHVTADANGNVYVTDRGSREVWVYEPSGEASRFWSVPDDDPDLPDVIPNGLTYDASTETLLVADAEVNVIYRVSLEGETLDTVYRYAGASGEGEPGFDGITVDAAGNIYAAAAAARSLVMVDPEANELIYLADNFRGISDVAAVENRIYASNLDGQSIVLPGIDPQTPFSIDVVTLDPLGE